MFQEYVVIIDKCISLQVLLQTKHSVYSLGNILSLESQVFPGIHDKAKEALCWHVCIYLEFR